MLYFFLHPVLSLTIGRRKPKTSLKSFTKLHNPSWGFFLMLEKAVLSSLWDPHKSPMGVLMVQQWCTRSYPLIQHLPFFPQTYSSYRDGATKLYFCYTENIQKLDPFQQFTSQEWDLWNCPPQDVACNLVHGCIGVVYRNGIWIVLGRKETSQGLVKEDIFQNERFIRSFFRLSVPGQSVF